MKRILSLFLSVFMLVGVVSGVDFSAYADSLPKSANNESYTQIYVDQPVSFEIKNNDELKKFLFIPEKDGVFAFSSECRNSNAHLYDSNNDYLNPIKDNRFYGDGFHYQYELKAGQKYYLNVNVFLNDNSSLTCDIKVKFVPDSKVIVDSVYNAQSVYQIEEGTKGTFVPSDKGKYFQYNRFEFFSANDSVTLIYKDGHKIELINDEEKRAFVNKTEGIFIGYNSYSFSSNQSFENQWVAGNRYNVVVGIGKEENHIEVNFPVDIVENSVESVTFIPKKPFEIKENSHGFWRNDKNGENYYNYNIVFNDEDTLSVKYKNGQTVEYIYNSEVNRFVSNDGDVIDYVIDDDQYENHWTAGNTYSFKLICHGKSLTFPVTIVEDPYATISIEYILTDPYEIIENTNGYWTTDEKGDKYFHYNYDCAAPGSSLVVHCKNGTKKVYKEKSGRFVNDNGEYLENVSWSDLPEYQGFTHWTVGNTYGMKLSYNGFSCTAPISIVNSSLASISFIPVKSPEMVENVNGHWERNNETGEEYFLYDLPWFNIGDVLEVTDKSGKTVKYEYQNNDNFISSTGDVINENDIEWDSNQYYKPWSVGTDNYYTLNYLGKEAKVFVKILENPCVNISFIPVKSPEMVENVNGHWERNNETGEEYFLYDLPWFNIGDVLEVTDKSGKTVKYEYQNNDNFISSTGDVINENDIEWDSNQYYKPWSVGTDNYYTLNYLGKEAKVFVKILENPCVSISFIPVKSPELIENVDGDWERNDETGEEYFWYSLPRFNNGDILEVTDKSGKTVKYEYQYNEETDESNFVSSSGDVINENDIKRRSNQYNKHWSVGTDNYYTISYYGLSIDVPISIIENPIKSISYSTPDEFKFKECVDGNISDEGNFYYNLKPDGAVLRVEYKNGTQTDYVYNIQDDKFVSQDGEVLDEKYLNIISDQNENPWALGGTYEFTVSYCGVETTCSATIVDNGISSVEYIPANKEIQEYTNGYWTFDNDIEYYYYNCTYCEGDTLIINYKDNTQTKYVCKKIDVDGSDSLDFYDKDGNPFKYNIYFESNQDYNNQWTAGNTYTSTISCLGKNIDVNIKILPHNHNYYGGVCLLCRDKQKNYVFPNLIIGKNQIEISKEGQLVLLKYVPKNDCVVTINSIGDLDTFAYLYDNDMNCLVKNDDFDDSNFALSYQVDEGKTYYVGIRLYNSDSVGAFDVNVAEKPIETDTTVLDYLLSIIDGYSPEDFSESTYNELMNRINSIPDDLSNLSQKQVDSIVENILDGMNGLDPYLEFDVNAPNGSFTVQYGDESNVRNKNSVLYGTSVTLTATPNEGYKFVGWYDTVNNLYFSKNSEYTFTVIANTYLKAVFVKNDSSTLTFTTYTNWVKSTVTKTLDEWKNMNSIADFVPDVPYRYGYTNGRWVYDEADVIAKLQAGEDVSIVAEYDKKNVELPTPPTPVNNEPAAELHYDFDEETSTGSFLLAVGLPEDCRVESMGILFYYDDAQTFDPTNFTLFITNKMMASRFNVGELNGVCISNIRNMSSDYNWVAKGYISYYEDDGSLVTKYSNQIEVVDRQQI